MAPFVSSLLRRNAHRGIYDDFNRTVSGSLGSTSVGNYAWNILSGVWSVNGTVPTTTTAEASSPFAVISPGYADIDTTILAGAGDALYFRVQDVNNWWRLSWNGYQSSSGCQICCDRCCQNCCQRCCSVCSSSSCCCNAPSSCSDYCSGCSGSCPYGCSCGTCTTSCNCVDCNCVSCNCVNCNCVNCGCTYYDNYQVRLDKNVAGTITSGVATGTAVLSTPTVTLRVVAKGSTITGYYNSTSSITTTQTGLVTATQHGFGRASSNYDSIKLDNYSLTNAT